MPDRHIPLLSIRDGLSQYSGYGTTAHVTANGDWCRAVAIEHPESGANHLGAIVCASSKLRQPIAVGQPNAWIDLRTIGISQQPGDRVPALTYRTVSMSKTLGDAYTGELWYSTIASDGQVSSVKIQADCNCGFNPRLTFTESRDPTLLSFNYSPYGTVCHFRSPCGLWSSHHIG